MRATIFALAAVALLAACNNNNAPAGVRGQACALVGDAQAVFGRAIEGAEGEALEGLAGNCVWRSEDGAIYAELVTYNAASTGNWRAESAADFYKRLVAAWAGELYTQPRELEALGDEAALVAPMPGDNVNIAIRKGDAVAFIAANSLAPGASSDDIARKLAAAVAAKL